jgi:hypothetical protein
MGFEVKRFTEIFWGPTLGCWGGGLVDNGEDYQIIIVLLLFPMDPSTFLGSVWGIIYYNLEG